MSARDRLGAIAPITIAVEQLKIGRSARSMKASGIDLESGRRVSLVVRIDDADESYLTAEPAGPLVLVISVERLSLV